MRERGDQPKFIEPMLLPPGDPRKRDDWTYEAKWDGIRTQLR